MSEQEQLFSELRDDLRRDQLKRLWEQHGSLLIAISVAIVLGTGIGVAWRDYQASRNRAFTGELMQALETKNEAGVAALKGASASLQSHPQGALAQLRLGAAELEAGKPEAALAEYKALAEDKHQDQGLRDLARVLEAHVATNSGVDLPAAPELKPSEPFYDAWSEAVAWHDYAKGRQAEALTRFAALRDDMGASPPLRSRMQVVTSFLAPATPAESKE